MKDGEAGGRERKRARAPKALLAAKAALREGKRPTTAAGEFVREEVVSATGQRERERSSTPSKRGSP